jgi:hypothetical protein
MLTQTDNDLKKGPEVSGPYGIIWIVHTRLEWAHPPKGGGAMNISFGEVLTFGIFLLALLTYIDKRK